MPTLTPPDYSGGALVNLIADLEERLSGATSADRLHDDVSRALPESDGYVLVLFDGLGHAQLEHPHAVSMAESEVAAIDSGFPATTTASLATVATGLTPNRHGLIGYQLLLPDAGVVMNTIRWTTLWGEPLPQVVPETLLPRDNLWERLALAGIEPVTVQPGNFASSALTRALYRGCRFEGAWSPGEIVEATKVTASPGRLVFTYVPYVDFAAHVHGQASDEYAAAVRLASWIWSRLRATLPSEVGLIGVADHGHIDFPPNRQFRIDKADHDGRTFYGDARAMFVRGDGASLAPELPATWVPIEECEPWWGPGPSHPQFDARKPDGVLVADDDSMLLHRFSDDRMIGNHGGLVPEESVIPLLVR